MGATTTNGPANAGAITTAQAGPISRVWDPILVAQLTQGGMCCDAEYYRANGVGRGTVSEVGAISAYDPPLTGGDMSAENSPGVMCPAHSKDDGYSTTTVGNVNQDNPAETELLEGQAFYVSLAPSQYSLPTTSSTAATQKANEAKQRKCATHITSMMKMNKAVAKTAAGTQTAPGAFGYDYSAINFPLWKVGIGSASPVNEYTVPNGYCYANACFTDLAKVGTQSTFKGTEKLGELVKGPNMALIDATPTACGRANVACATAPATWNGGPAVMNKLGCTATTCTAAGILNTTGAIPVA